MFTGKFRPPKYNSLSRQNSSLYLLKALYQRNMLIAMMLVAGMVIVPVIVLAYWPDVENNEDIILKHDDIKPDTIVIDLQLDPEIIISRDYSVLQGGVKTEPGSTKRTGWMIEDFKLVSDDFAVDELLEFGQNDNNDYNPDSSDVIGDLSFGGSGSVFIQDTTTYNISDALDRIPELIYFPATVYPPLAKRVDAECKIILHLLVNIDGTVSNVVIYDISNPQFGFERHASLAAKSAVFSPAIRNNQPVRCWVSFPVIFTLEDR
ncbi:MAG: energy transducer TonB [Candidatus Zixiibacteriota bacterium]